MASLRSSYLREVYEATVLRNPGENEFLQAVLEVLHSIDIIIDEHPEFSRHAIVERLVEPERFIQFQVPWVDDAGKTRVNRGYRAQFNSALGPYKGGLRFHPTVSASAIKFLGFEQTFKNALTGLPLGGGKGGADFDPKGKSDGEVRRFCQSYMTELSRHLGQFTDVPAGDIGVGAREVGYMFGQYKRITNEFTGVLTGKLPTNSGSLGRKEATGYGLVYIVQEMLSALRQESLEGKTVVVSGSGNVAIYAAEKAAELGAKVVTVSDSAGYVYDEKGIDLDILKQIKEVERGRLTEYVKRVPGARYVEGSAEVWKVPCDIALPCAIQNELDGDSARALVKNGVRAVAEGSNMSTTPEGVEVLHKAGVLYLPGKAANAGGVAVSGLEMSQNSLRLSWTKEEVDERLQRIMTSIFHTICDAAEAYGHRENFVAGANIAGLLNVSQAMVWQG
jgi:glutamate dehydrogenase (NADP+)